jgi:branched-chain amino acid transport system permease protein
MTESVATGATAVGPSSTSPPGAAGQQADRAAEVRSELKLFRSRWSLAGAVVFVVALVAVPLSTADPFLLALGATGGIYAVGAIGLNLLMGYAGQISLGHSFFVSVGAFTAVAVGGLAELPLPVWIVAATAAGGLLGALVGPFALRLRGLYQIVLTLGLVYVGNYVFANWSSLTGGSTGTSVRLPMALGPVDFGALQIGAITYSYQQGLFILAWLCVAVCLLVVRNVVRSRPGRAMMAVRDGELAAEVAGLPAKRSKINAFALSGALAGLAGALLVAQLSYVVPGQFSLQMSITFLVMIIVGGVGTTWGPVIGAVLVSSIPLLIEQYSEYIPLLKSDFDAAGGFGLGESQFNLLAYGLLLFVFVLVEPRGLVHVGKRIAARLRRRRTSPT